jgi:hypothetical protein
VASAGPLDTEGSAPCQTQRYATCGHLILHGMVTPDICERCEQRPPRLIARSANLPRGGQTVTRWQRVSFGVFMAAVSLSITGAVVTSGDTDDTPASRCETWESCRP